MALSFTNLFDWERLNLLDAHSAICMFVTPIPPVLLIFPRRISIDDLVTLTRKLWSNGWLLGHLRTHSPLSKWYSPLYTQSAQSLLSSPPNGQCAVSFVHSRYLFIIRIAPPRTKQAGQSRQRRRRRFRSSLRCRLSARLHIRQGPAQPTA